MLLLTLFFTHAFFCMDVVRAGPVVGNSNSASSPQSAPLPPIEAKVRPMAPVPVGPPGSFSSADHKSPPLIGLASPPGTRPKAVNDAIDGNTQPSMALKRNGKVSPPGIQPPPSDAEVDQLDRDQDQDGDRAKSPRMGGETSPSGGKLPKSSSAADEKDKQSENKKDKKKFAPQGFSDEELAKIKALLRDHSKKVGPKIQKRQSKRPKPVLPPELEAVEQPKTLFDINIESGAAEYLVGGDILMHFEQLAQRVASDPDYEPDGPTEPSAPTNETRGRQKRQTDTTAVRKWTLPVAYEFAPSADAPTQAAFQKGVQFVEQRTCIRFVQNAASPNRIRVVKGAGCTSNIGFQAGWQPQELSLGPGCDNLVIATHEICHAMGIDHHQSRNERNDYITVDMSQVSSGNDPWYGRHTTPEWSNYDTQYDLSSVMHYGPVDFAIGTTPIMRTLKPEYQISIGAWNLGPAFADIRQLNQHYCASTCNDQNPSCAYWASIGECTANPGYMLPYCSVSCSVACQNGGYKHPNQCNTCICPSGFGGPLCAQKAGTCGSTVTATGTWQTLTGSATPSATDDFSSCVYHIQAPAGKTVELVIAEVQTPSCSQGCQLGTLELQLTNFTKTGIKYCCASQVENYGYQASSSNLAIARVVSAKNTSASSFKLFYRIGIKRNTCYDFDKSCAYWAGAGECVANPGYMNVFCPASCNACPCFDLDTTNCAGWASAGECTANPGYMGYGCAASCDLCYCRNYNTSCAGWASAGECTANPGYMKPYCAKACQLCGASTCTDSDASCANRASQGECTSNPTFMNANCKAACNVCLPK